MRTIIAGSRDEVFYSNVIAAINTCEWKITAILSGGARGADKLGERAARELNIPLEIYPAQWDIFGKSAGYRRNEEMANHAEALIAIWNGHSKGTKHMIDLATRKGLRVFVYRVI